MYPLSSEPLHSSKHRLLSLHVELVGRLERGKLTGMETNVKIRCISIGGGKKKNMVSTAVAAAATVATIAAAAAAADAAATIAATAAGQRSGPSTHMLMDKLICDGAAYFACVLQALLLPLPLMLPLALPLLMLPMEPLPLLRLLLP